MLANTVTNEEPQPALLPRKLPCCPARCLRTKLRTLASPYSFLSISQTLRQVAKRSCVVYGGFQDSAIPGGLLDPTVQHGEQPGLSLEPNLLPTGGWSRVLLRSLPT